MVLGSQPYGPALMSPAWWAWPAALAIILAVGVARDFRR
jgi:hypothetical protein